MSHFITDHENQKSLKRAVAAVDPQVIECNHLEDQFKDTQP